MKPNETKTHAIYRKPTNINQHLNGGTELLNHLKQKQRILNTGTSQILKTGAKIRNIMIYIYIFHSL